MNVPTKNVKELEIRARRRFTIKSNVRKKCIHISINICTLYLSNQIYIPYNYNDRN